MRVYIKHLSPWLSSFCIWIAKATNVAFFSKPTAVPSINTTTAKLIDFTDVMLWTLLSLFMSSIWRIGVDRKTLCTATEARPKSLSAFVLHGERAIVAILVFVLTLLAGKGGLACFQAGFLPVFGVVYVVFPAYLVLGLQVNKRFGEDRHKIRAISEPII
jgi:hypothetical protein